MLGRRAKRGRAVKKRWIFTGVAGLLAALFLGGVAAVGASTGWFGIEELASREEDSQWPYRYQTSWDPTDRGMEGLRITWGNGSISVRPTDAPLVTVTEYAARPLEESELLGLTFSGDTLEVSWDGGLLPLGAFQGWEKRVEVEVPRAVLAQLEELSCWNLSGSMTVEDVGAQKASLTSFRGDLSLSRVQCGELRLSTVSGIVQLARSTAQELSVETDSGGARIQSVQAGECRLKSVTGPVSFVESAAEELTIQTVSGPVLTRLEGCPETADLRSVSGDITLGLRENNGFDAAYSSVSGRFASDFIGAESKGALRYRQGGPQLSLTTTWGNMEIQRLTGVYAEMAGG